MDTKFIQYCVFFNEIFVNVSNIAKTDIIVVNVIVEKSLL